MKKKYPWKCTNVRTDEVRQGFCGDLEVAKTEAEVAKREMGSRYVVAHITGARGAHWQLEPREGNRSGMVWRKYPKGEA